MNNSRPLFHETSRKVDPRTFLSETTGDVERSPSSGRLAIILAGLAIGILLLALQLWFLTIALDLYLSGRTDGTWELAVISGLIFIGGLFVWRALAPRRY